MAKDQPHNKNCIKILITRKVANCLHQNMKNKNIQFNIIHIHRMFIFISDSVQCKNIQDLPFPGDIVSFGL